MTVVLMSCLANHHVDALPGDTRPPPREVLINPADTNIQHIYITADPTSVTVMDVLSSRSTHDGYRH